MRAWLANLDQYFIIQMLLLGFMYHHLQSFKDFFVITAVDN